MRPTRKSCIALAPALAALLLPPSALAQQPPPSFGERIEAQLVNVEVSVTDRDGRPVLDLAREDFRVFEDGRRVEITHFSPPEAAAETAGLAARDASSAAGAPDEAAGGWIAIFLDELHTKPAGRRRTIDQLEEVLRGGLDPGDRVMLASYDGGLRVRLPFSADRKTLWRALEEAREIVPLSLVGSLDEERTLRELEAQQHDDAQGGWVDRCVNTGMVARSHAEEAYNRVLGTADALGAFVDSLAGLPGRKTVLHVSDGIPLVAGGEVYSYAISLCDGTAAATGHNPDGFDVTSMGAGRWTRFDPVAARADMDKYDTTHRWQRLTAAANSQRVSFYPVQAAGLAVLRSSTVEALKTPGTIEAYGRHNRQDTLSLLASETGGRAILDANDLRPGLERALADAAHQYLLAYPPPVPGDGRRHRIRVEVDRPGASVRHRQSYESKSFHQQVADGVLSSLFHGAADNPLGVRLELVETERAGGSTTSTRVRLDVPLANLTLLPDGASRHGLFTVFLAVRDGAGGTTAVRQKSIPVRVAQPEVAATGSPSFTFEVEIDLSPGEVRLAAALLDELGGVASYAHRDLRLGGR